MYVRHAELLCISQTQRSVNVWCASGFLFVLNIAFPGSTQKKHMELMEHAISEALINDPSVATKHFVVHVWEVLSTVLIQLARLISH